MSFSVRAGLEQFALDHPSGEGRLTISVAPPAVELPESGVPVLYVVDGDLLFGMAAEIARALTSVASLPPHYVVGIGYDAAYGEFMKLRTADLTPELGDKARAAMGGVGDAIGSERSGGADALLSLLSGDLAREIGTRYPKTAGGRRVLFGHSLGGLFAAHALLTRPDAFDAFIISSPSLWWNGFALMQQLPGLGERLGRMASRPRVFVDVGAREQDLPQSVPPGLGVTLEEAQAQIRAARMVDAAKEFADALSEAGIAELCHVAFPLDDHVSVAPAALLHGMRFALGQGA